MVPRPSPAPRLDTLLAQARGRIDAFDAELLLAHACGKPRAWLYAHGADPIAAGVDARFRAFVARRAAGEPVAYLVGRRGFWRFDLAVTPDTLIPRPETERLVESALQRMPANEPVRAADLGTGSGAIALALAHERPRAQLVATDRSAAALAVARDNAHAEGVGNIEFRHGDWYEPLAGERFDLIVSNPPYVAEGDRHLEQDGLRHEPQEALVSGLDGLDAIRAIVASAPAHLRPAGWLLLEHGCEQGAAVRGLLERAGLADVSTAQDLAGHDRVTSGRIAIAR